MGDQVTDEELDMIFMKVDTNCDGTVDWEEYLTYMLLECREKDSMNVQSLRLPFPRDVRKFKVHIKVLRSHINTICIDVNTSTCIYTLQVRKV